MPEFPTGDPIGRHSAHATSSSEQDWKSSLMDLIAARSEIIRIELADFRKQSAQRGTLVVLAILSATFGWMLILAGLVPLLAQALGLSWPLVALLLGVLHILLLGCFLYLARRQSTPAFTATLSEFQKDREWIENISKTPKS